jgi:two-component system sensor histidine kinase FlrB
MSVQNPAERQQLKDAFLVFNQVSEQLVDSYQQLQKRVLQLNRELASSRDERLRQLAEKERLANRLSQLLDALPAAVVVLDGDNRIQEFNPKAMELLGRIRSGEPWSDLYGRLFHPGKKRDEQHLRNGRLVSITERTLAPESGRIVLLLDITETRQLQERLDRQERLSAMGEMAAQLAHQIRTPLSSALLYTAHLRRDDLSPAQRQRFADRSLTRLQLMERQINDMLSFARGGQNTQERIDISTLLRELGQMLEPMLLSHNAHLELLDRSAGDCVLVGNPDELLGALSNLANNAMEHGGEGVVLRIELNQPSDHRLELTVSDNGPGIPEEIRGRIFDPFFTTRNDGTGLGLAVVQAVVLSHGGEIELLQREQQGSSFRLTLPIAKEQKKGVQHRVADRISGERHSLLQRRNA